MRKLSFIGFLAIPLFAAGGAFADRPTETPPSGAAALHCASGRQIMIRDLHNLRVQNTREGAVISMKADTPSEAADIQRLARMMVDCMSEGAALKK